MKLSTRGRYALRLMLDLALQAPGASISLRTVAQRQCISLKYLEQLVTPLLRSDYLKAVRGAQGGYLLTKSPEEYTVGMILRTIEGSLAPVACVDAEGSPCQRETICATVEVYRKIDNAIDQVVDSITLADLVQMQYDKWGGTQPPDKS